jgi:MYXO-CTERM domain-containing protein
MIKRRASGIRRWTWPLMALVLVGIVAEPAWAKGQANKARLQEANRLHGQAMELYEAGKLDEAETIQRSALTILDQEEGPDHLDVAAALYNLALGMQRKRDCSGAEPLYLRSLAIREKLSGQDDPDLVMTLRGLGFVYRCQGKYEAAEPLLRRALAIQEKTLGPDHVDVAVSLSDLAYLCDAEGNQTEAELLVRRALAIREKTLGPDDIAVAESLSTLGWLMRREGDYTGAEPQLRRALLISAKTLGQEHADIANNLSRLADVLQNQGDYEGAEPLFRRALAIREKAYGPDDGYVGTSLYNVATVLQDKGELSAAEPMYRRALAIVEKARGPEHKDVAIILNHLGTLLERKGDYAEAEPLYRRALAIREKILGADDLEVATSLSDVAGLLRSQGKYEEAEPLCRRALTIREKLLGPDDPGVAQDLQNLAVLYETKGDYTSAEPLYRRALTIDDRHGFGLLQSGSERRRTALRDGTNIAISFHVQKTPESAASRELALGTILRRKGFVPEVRGNGLTTAAKRAEPSEREKLEEFISQHARLARLVAMGPWPGIKSEEYRRDVTALSNRLETLQPELLARHAELRAAERPVTVASVQAALPPGAVLIEYAAYQPFNGKAKPDERFGEPRYVAYVLGQKGQPRHVELGPAAPIDKAAVAYLDALSRKQPGFLASARNLDELMMRPVRALLGDTREIYVSPDGALNLVPFASLVDEQGQFLIARYRFNMLTSGRDLLRFEERIVPKSESVLVGGAAYGGTGLGDGSRGALSKDFGETRFEPLPEASWEVEGLGKLLPKARVLTGNQATEGALKAVRAPRILHLATRGFFLQDIKSPRGVNAPRFAARESSMLRAGLALAGANQRESGIEDGILTAREVSELDLWGTQLVVLSACEAGGGEVRNAEAVQALRRALVVAGSETQLTSLWKVDDETTRKLMAGYYQRVLGGRGRIDALRSSQLGVLAEPATSHPYFWAAFMAAGDGRTLDYQQPKAVKVEPIASAAEVTDALKVEPKRGGCACSVPGERSAGGQAPWWLVGLGVALGRRIRRQSRIRARGSVGTGHHVVSGAMLARAVRPKPRRVHRRARPHALDD